MNPESHWIKSVVVGSQVRAVGIQAKALIQQLVTRHKLAGDVATGLGEGVISALTLASYTKSGERINLTVKGSREVSRVVVEAYPDGRLRAYARSTSEGENKPSGGGIWGTGELAVLRTQESAKLKPYTGVVPLVTGRLAKDLTYYWAQSEQVPSAVGICVHVEGSEVKAAGGFLLQAMPGAKDSELAVIEDQINSQRSDFCDNVEKNEDPKVWLASLFEHFSFQFLEETPLKMECPCTRERVLGALVLLEAKDLEEMKLEDRPSVTCDFCSEEYQISNQELDQVLAKRSN